MTTSTEPTSPPPRSSGGALFFIVPAATFLVGLMLGAGLVWVAQPGGSDGGEPEPSAAGPEASPDEPAEASPDASPDATASSPGEEGSQDVVLTGACVQAAEASSQLVARVRDAVDALANLDTRELGRILDDLERLDGEIRQDAAACRTVPATSTPSPSP